MAKSSGGNLNYKMGLNLSTAISQLEALKKQMEKTFGAFSKDGVVNLKLNINTENAKKAIQQLQGLTISPKIRLNTSGIKSQLHQAMSGASFTPRVAGAAGGANNAANVAAANAMSQLARTQQQLFTQPAQQQRGITYPNRANMPYQRQLFDFQNLFKSAQGRQLSPTYYNRMAQQPGASNTGYGVYDMYQRRGMNYATGAAGFEGLRKSMQSIFANTGSMRTLKIDADVQEAKAKISSLNKLPVNINVNTNTAISQMKKAINSTMFNPKWATNLRDDPKQISQAFRDTIGDSQRAMYQGRLHGITGPLAGNVNYQRFSAYQNAWQPHTSNVGGKSFDMYNQNYMRSKELQNLARSIERANLNTGSVRTNQIRGILGMGGYSPQMWQQYNQMAAASGRPSTTSQYRTYDSPEQIRKQNYMDRTAYNRYLNKTSSAPYIPGVTRTTSKYDPNVSNLTTKGMLGTETKKNRYNLTEMMDMYILSSSLQQIGFGINNVFDELNTSFESIAPSFRKTQVVTGMNDPTMQTYKKDMYELTKSTMTPLSTLGEMGYSFATRGYMDPETATESLEPLAISSLIAGESPVQMGKSVMSLMQAWNPMGMEQLEGQAPRMIREYSDLMTYAYASSPLETRWFKDIANYAAPVFSGLGFEPNETMSTFMAMSQMIPTPGIGARSARMALSNLFDLNKLNKVSEDYGIDLGADIEKVKAEGGGLADIFQRLGERIKSLPENQQNTFMRTIGGGVRGGMALQALLPVIGNIEDYRRNIEAESEGYTMLAQEEYASKPLGRLKMAEAEKEALTYQMGEKSVGARTAYMKLENAILKLVNKLPEGVVAAGFGAGKGFEAVAGITGQAANIAMLKMVSQNLGQKAGLMGGLSTAVIGATFVVPLVTAIGTAIESAYQKEQGREAGERKEEMEGLDVFQRIEKLMEGWTSRDTRGEGLTREMLGDTGAERFKNTNINILNKMLGEDTAFYEGEVEPTSNLIRDVKLINQGLSGAIQSTIDYLPSTIDDSKKNLMEEKLESMADYLPGLGNFTKEGIKETIGRRIDIGSFAYGDVPEYDKDNKEESLKSITEVSNKNLEESLKGMDMSKYGGFVEENRERMLHPDALLFSLANHQIRKGDLDTTSISKEEAKKFGESETMKSILSLLPDDPDVRSEAKSYYTDVAIKVADIYGEVQNLNGLMERSNELASEAATAPDSYKQMIAAWMRGDLKGNALPGGEDMATMTYGFNKYDREGSMVVGFENQAGAIGMSRDFSSVKLPEDAYNWKETNIGSVMGEVSTDFLTKAKKTGGGVSELEKNFYNKYKSDVEGLLHSMNMRNEGVVSQAYGP